MITNRPLHRTNRIFLNVRRCECSDHAVMLSLPSNISDSIPTVQMVAESKTEEEEQQFNMIDVSDFNMIDVAAAVAELDELPDCVGRQHRRVRLCLLGCVSVDEAFVFLKTYFMEPLFAWCTPVVV